MSQRNTTQKKINRLRKLMRQPLPVGFDLVQWLIDHRHAQTVGEAKRLILNGRVRAGSHTIGTEVIDGISAIGQPEKQTVVARYQPARYKPELIVLRDET